MKHVSVHDDDPDEQGQAEEDVSCHGSNSFWVNKHYSLVRDF